MICLNIERKEAGESMKARVRVSARGVCPGDQSLEGRAEYSPLEENLSHISRQLGELDQNHNASLATIHPYLQSWCKKEVIVLPYARTSMSWSLRDVRQIRWSGTYGTGALVVVALLLLGVRFARVRFKMILDDVRR